ncbi:hypothetical protein [Granulicella sp. S156]|jgi:hypothetical protein|uniref:hypothetical protein n=1 Tax=Granulicella sp. S156 TaxID=1747224 RepID=UPI00131D1276|nr:hypothetical protein [Granulicella sp. S156]
MRAASKVKTIAGLAAGVLALAGVFSASAQTPAAAPHASGTVKATTDTGITVTTTAGQDYTVAVPAAASILEVAPGSHDLKSATPAHLGDIAVGDKVLVTGAAGDTGTALTAQRIIVMKSAAIAETHAAESEAWTQGGGGIVKSVNASAGTITISSGLKIVAVQTTPATIIRRYSDGSVRFEDAVKSSIGAIQPGDQLRVRGTKSADGSSVAADEIVTGSFSNFSGTIASIDGTAGTLTLKDLATKKTVIVAITPNSDVHRIPVEVATRMAARLRGGSTPGATPGANGAAAPAGGQAPAEDGQHRAGRAGMDLSQMLSRLPTETLAGLKTGEAVMIVASASQPGKATAVTLLAGVEPILAAQPAGQAMTLSPWSIGGGGDAGGGQQ